MKMKNTRFNNPYRLHILRQRNKQLPWMRETWIDRARQRYEDPVIEIDMSKLN